MKDPIRSYLLIDWHDGMTTGVVEFASEPGQWLATLVAWAPERRLRAFGLVRLTADELASLEAAAKNNLESAVDVARRIVAYASTAQLLVTSPAMAEIFALRPLDSSELASIATFDVADAVMPGAQRYLQILDAE